MEANLSSQSILEDLHQCVESQIDAFLQIKHKSIELSTPQQLEELESMLHQKAQNLADTLTGIKLQEQLDAQIHQKEAKALMASQPGRMKNMGSRRVTIRLLGGTQVTFSTYYYHRASKLKKHQGKKGCYPQLLLLGIAKQHTPAMESLISLMATASSSYAEARHLIVHLLGFQVDVKTIRCVVKRFAEKARAAMRVESIEMDTQELSGRRVAASVAARQEAAPLRRRVVPDRHGL